MKHLIPILSIVILSACSAENEKRASEADIAATREVAEREASEVLTLPDGSMEQENAILALRAHETAIRSAGYEECADTFAGVSRRILNPVLQTKRAVLK